MEKRTTMTTILNLFLRELREERHRHQAQVADYLKIQLAGWKKIEDGKINLNMSTFFNVCEYFQVPPSEVLKKVEHYRILFHSAGWTVLTSNERLPLNEDRLLVMATEFYKERGPSDENSFSEPSVMAGPIIFPNTNAMRSVFKYALDDSNTLQ